MPNQATQTAKVRFVERLKDRARARNIPIEATSWFRPGDRDIYQLTIVSKGQSFTWTFSDPLDLLDNQRDSVREGIIDLILNSL